MHTANAHRFAPAAPDEEYVFGACAPGWHSAAGHDVALSDWLRSMRDHEVDRVCCLLAGRRLDADGAIVDRYIDEFGEPNVLHAPVPDSRLVPEPRLNGEILPYLADARTVEDRIVVHCLTGVGRTGQVLAAWLVHSRDYGPERAIETVQEVGRDPMEAVERDTVDEADVIGLLSAVARR